MLTVGFAQIKEKNGKFNFINDWNIEVVGARVTIYNSFKAHKDHIMDLVEIMSRSAVVTCSLDRSIKLWDLFNGTKMGSLKPKHSAGVRGLDYTPDFSGVLVSVAHESKIKVWSTEVSLHRAHMGILEGHTAPLVSAKFIKLSPYLVSIDERLSIRVWDVRSLSCMQVILEQSKKFLCNGICTLGEQHRFLLFGKRLILYDTAVEKAGQSDLKVLEDSYPFDAEFNKHYKMIVIVTKIDVRLHDCASGQMVRIFSQFASNSRPVTLTSFCMEGNHRKFYVGDNSGSVRTYNVGNGVYIKSVTEGEQMKGKDPDVSSQPIQNKREISGLEFVDADQLLISSSLDSVINVYDEEDPDMSVCLRSTQGGSGESPIVCMRYSEHLSLLATGASNGSVVVWDYERTRVEAVCTAHSRAIAELQFVSAHPLLLSCSNEGLVCMWGVRGIGAAMAYALRVIVAIAVWRGF